MGAMATLAWPCSLLGKHAHASVDVAPGRLGRTYRISPASVWAAWAAWPVFLSRYQAATVTVEDA